MSTTDAHRLNIEILKLLLQVAWADHDVGEEEVAVIIGGARNGGLSDAAVEILESCLRGDTKLPAPDLGLLREHREVTMAAVEKLVHSDAVVTEEEEHVLEEIRVLLR